ncbi:MAG: glycosyltransferase family 87 protein [Candidatus Sulfotelmatobacter sp.]
MKAGSKTWLTPKRLRTHGLLLAVALWGLYVWTIATPGLRDRNGNLKGTDFLHLYALGSLAAEHRGADLYDINAQAALVAQRVPDAAGIRYLPLYPPQVSIFFAPLAGLSYGWALSVWWIFSAAIYGICCCSVWRACPKLRDHGGTVPLLAAASPAFFNLIAWGQTSAVALACFTLMYFLLRDRREFIAGVALGCLIFKPQLGLAAAVVFAAIGAWKILAGAALSSAAQLSLGAIYYGTEPFRRWLGMLWNIRALLPWLEPKPYQTHCLRTFWAMIVPWPALSFALYGASAAIILIVTIRLWNRDQSVPLALRYSALLLATVLVAPHLTVYDLVVLAPAILILSDWLAGQHLTGEARRAGTLLYLVYALPLLGIVARYTHVQLSVLAMAALLFVIARLAPNALPNPDTRMESISAIAPR